MKRYGVMAVCAAVVVFVWVLQWVLKEYKIDTPDPVVTTFKILMIVGCVGLVIAFIVWLIMGIKTNFWNQTPPAP